VQERLDALQDTAAVREAVLVLAAGSPESWDLGAARIATTTGVPAPVVRRELARAAHRWDHDPRTVADEQVSGLSSVRDRAKATAAIAAPDAERAPSGDRPALPARQTPRTRAPQR